MTKEQTDAKSTTAPAQPAAGSTPKVVWDDSSMKTHYSNAFNMFSSQEEMTLLFGTNQTLYTGQEEITVELTNRIVMSPLRAKAFAQMLNGVLSEYEARYGDLK
jgi:hypothetical protein